MLLQHKNAVIYALDERAVEKHVDVVIRKAGGIDILFNSIGMEDVQGTLLVDIARTFAREGAKVYLGGRTLTKVQEVAKDIVAEGGAAEAASVDVARSQ